MAESNVQRWEDPPANPVRNMLEPTLVELKANPGRWAVVREAHYYSGRLHSKLREAGCEVVHRRVDGMVRLYARWPEGE